MKNSKTRLKWKCDKQYGYIVYDATIKIDKRNFFELCLFFVVKNDQIVDCERTIFANNSELAIFYDLQSLEDYTVGDMKKEFSGWESGILSGLNNYLVKSQEKLREILLSKK